MTFGVLFSFSDLRNTKRAMKAAPKRARRFAAFMGEKLPGSLTASLPLKNDGLEDYFPFGMVPFQGLCGSTSWI